MYDKRIVKLLWSKWKIFHSVFTFLRQNYMGNAFSDVVYLDLKRVFNNKNVD